MKARALWHTAGVVLLNAAGNYALTLGMRRAPAAVGPVLALLEPAAIVGVGLLVAWLLLRLRLLQMADLSFVLPLTAIGYLLNAAIGAVLLGEHVTAARWAGALFITGGAALTSSTPHETDTGTAGQQESPGSQGGRS
ncbi:MAG: hypothetical protein KatS3mg004_1289 [Bryobacteraceae bacterium]|nr:MAG: hypothetical protein KatS3mg004_1289 [Bryobacteraceae bacterium]